MYLAIDIGGTKTEFAMFEKFEPGSMTFNKTIQTNQNFEHAISQAAEIINSLEGVEKIGISITANPLEGNLKAAALIPQWEGKNYIEELKKLIKIEDVRIKNDAVCAGLAEITWGSASQFKKVVFLIVGTGFGGVFLDKTTGGEYPMEPGGMIIESKDGRKHKNLPLPGLAESYIGGGLVGDHFGKDLSTLSDDDEIWREIAKYCAISINNISTLLCPEIVVIGGGLVQKRSFIIDQINQIIEKEFNNYNGFVSLPKVKLSSIDGNASLYGALSILRDSQQGVSTP